MRIIAGEFGGRRLPAAVPNGTRPTTDRVREALFSMLESRGAIEGSHVLDLFAGTGALGLEALSRGAKSLIAVDKSPAAINAIRKNAAALGLAEQVCCVRADATILKASAIHRTAPASPFHLVLLDPPYADMAQMHACLERLLHERLLRPDALISLEMRANADLQLPQNLSELKRKRYGDSAIVLLTAMA